MKSMSVDPSVTLSGLYSKRRLTRFVEVLNTRQQ